MKKGKKMYNKSEFLISDEQSFTLTPYFFELLTEELDFKLLSSKSLKLINKEQLQLIVYPMY